MVWLPFALDSENSQLRTFQSWAHSTATLVIIVVAWLVLATIVLTPLSRRVLRHRPSDTARAVVVVLGLLGVASWVSRNWWFTTLMLVARGGCGVWYLIACLGTVMAGAGRFVDELDREKHAEAQMQRADSAERGAALDRTLGKIDAERREGG